MSRDQFSAIYHAGSSLTGARLKRARNEWSPGAPERQELPPAEPAAEGDAVQTGASPEVRRFTASFTDSVTYCLESRAAQFQFLSLPPADESEIRGMVELELEQRKILPLELDKMTLAIEPLSKSEDAMRLLVAAVPTEKLDEIHAKTGLSPARLHRIDIAALAALQSLEGDLKVHLAPSRHGRNLVLLEEAAFWTLVVVDNGEPVLIRSLGSVQTPPRTLLRAIRLSLLQADADSPAPSPVLAAIVLSPALSVDFEAALRGSEFGEHLQVGNADGPSVPAEKLGAAIALGAARRSAEGLTTFDLVPAAWREELADRSHRRRLLQIVAGGIALWAIAAAALFLGPSLLDKAIASEGAAVEALQPAVRSVSDVRHRVRLINAYMDRSFAPLEVLREIVLQLPDGITFNSLRYHRGDSRVVIAASANSTALVYEFKQNVDKTGMFRESQLTSGPTTNTRTGGADFELSVLLDTPPADEEGGSEP